MAFSTQLVFMKKKYLTQIKTHMKKLGLILLLGIGINASAQEIPKKWRYGFEVGANYSNVIGRDKTNGPGYELGISAKRKMGNQLYFNPIISFGQSNAKITDYYLFEKYLNFQPRINYYLNEDQSSTFFSFGFSVQKRLTPATIGTDLTKDEDVAINLGIGRKSSFKYFDLQTELRYSFGLTERVYNFAYPFDFGYNNVAPTYMHSLGIYFQFL